MDFNNRQKDEQPQQAKTRLHTAGLDSVLQNPKEEKMEDAKDSGSTSSIPELVINDTAGEQQQRQRLKQHHQYSSSCTINSNLCSNLCKSNKMLKQTNCYSKANDLRDVGGHH